MAVNKRHDEFYTLNMDEGWETPQDIRPVSSRRFFQVP